jgi:DNA-directed RNA polymerase specialized sigma subunit
MKQYADYTNEMLCAAIQAGDDYAKAVLIERDRRWVGKLAESFHKMLGMDAFATSAAIDDLIQAGNMAMLRAAERYE